MSKTSSTVAIAEYASSLRYDALDDAVIVAAKQSLLDWVGVALAGSQEPIASVVHGLLGEAGGGTGSSVVGYPHLVAAPFAALANGTIGHALDFDDTHLAGTLHTTTTVLPAALAIADRRQLSGQDLVTSYVAGFEVAAALASRVNPGQYERGWHTTGTIGTIGAAVSAGGALGLSVEAMRRAVSLAATQASGLQRVFGTMAKPFNAGRAAFSGTVAALLAAEGMTAPDDVLDGPRGLLSLLDRPLEFTCDLHLSTDALHLRENTVKLHACCHALHAAIEATLRLKPQIVDPTTITEVVVQGWPVAHQIAGVKHPQTGAEAKFSVYHAVATALIDGDTGMAAFTDGKLADQAIQTMAKRVIFQPDPGLDIHQARVAVTLADGTRHCEETTAVAGQVGHLELWPELERKVRTAAATGVDETVLSLIIERIRAIERHASLAPFWMFLTQP